MKYFQRKRKEKLYRQWMERAGLPPEAVRPETADSESIRPQVDSAEAVGTEAYKPLTVHIVPDDRVATHPEVGGDMMEEIDRRELRLRLPYVLLGASLVVLCVVLIVLIVLSC